LKNKPIINAIALTAKDIAFKDEAFRNLIFFSLLDLLYVAELLIITHLKY